MAWVKICGILDLKTALFAAEAGVDAVGFVFAKSKRQISPAQARLIASSLPFSVLKIGVFVNAPVEQVQELTRFCMLDAVQLHGQESPEYCSRLSGCKVIKSFSAGKGFSLKNIEDYPTDFILIDTYVPGKPGGTGKCFDWDIIKGLSFEKPLILAGGLTPENVKQAIIRVKPYGVDVSSGVESNGTKDKEKITRFIKNAKEVD